MSIQYSKLQRSGEPNKIMLFCCFPFVVSQDWNISKVRLVQTVTATFLGIVNEILFCQQCRGNSSFIAATLPTERHKWGRFCFVFASMYSFFFSSLRFYASLLSRKGNNIEIIFHNNKNNNHLLLQTLGGNNITAARHFPATAPWWGPRPPQTSGSGLRRLTSWSASWWTPGAEPGPGQGGPGSGNTSPLIG